MTAQGPASPDRNGSNNDNNGSPTSPVKVNDDKTVASGSTQASQASSRASSGPLSRSKNELEMLEEEIRQSEQLLEGDGTSSDAKEESQKLPSTPERGTADQGGEEEVPIDAPARSVSSSPPQEEESSSDQVVALTPVRNHRSPATIDHAGNVSQIDSVSPSKDPLAPNNTAEESSPSRTIPDAPSPARSTGSSGVWFSGIDANGQELSIDEPLKKQDTLNSNISTRTDFEDELNTTIPDSTNSSTDGHDPEPVKQPKKKDPSATDPLESITNRHLSAFFFCLVVFILGVILFLVYVMTHPEFVPPTSSPTTSFMPSYVPSSAPTDWVPSASPTGKPSFETTSPSDVPSANPSEHPSREPSIVPTPSPSSIPSSNPTERDPAEDLTTVLATYSETLKDRIQQDLNSKQREAFEWLIRDPEFYTYSERQLMQRYVLALFALEMTVPNPGRQRNLRGNDIHGERNLNWNSLETWLQYTDECTWFTSYYFDRVGCDRNGTWKRLVLYNLDLQGTIPSELALLTRMETLVLSNHTISGTIPRELSNLPMLKKLDLSGNRLNGRIPVQFSRLVKLEELYLQRNQLGNVIPPDFGSLTALRRMDVSTNSIIGRLPTQVGLMAALERLDVSDNQIGNSIPSEMGQLQQLRRLDLSGNGFLGNIPLQLGLYRLTHIDLHQNQLVGTVPARLGALRDLVYLDVSRNPLSGPFPAEVCSLKRGTFWNATSGQTESHTMFKADCAAVGCTCCTDCNY
ncbi:MAG: hypothetical protein SGBAC_009790 [Bacillariaceae sp.]